MRGVMWGLAVIALSLGTDDPAPPSATVLIARLDESQGWYDRERQAGTTGERRDAVDQRWRDKLVALARDAAVAVRAEPADPNSFDLIDRLLGAGVGDDEEISLRRILYTALRDDPRLARDCSRLAFHGRFPDWPEARGWLETATRSAVPAVRGQAYLALGMVDADLGQITRYLVVNPDEAQSGQFLSNMLGGDQSVQELLKVGAESWAKRAEASFAEVNTSYPSISTANGRSMGEIAAGRLAELRELTVGKMAPEIGGRTIDGRSLTLAEHRGRVVVVSFWGTWCGPCVALVPEEKALVARMLGRPFALLGIDTDEDAQTAARFVTDQGITWPSWFDGGDTRGPISTRWHVRSWPTVYVIDRRGVIRWQRPDFPHRQTIESVVEALLKEPEPAS